MRQPLLFAIILAANVVLNNYAQVNYIENDITIKDIGYGLGAFTTSYTAGGNTGGHHDNGSIWI
ncbi:Uncharacterised protein [Salmonella enterica subsp. salamae]|nr:Uncharacterised protein [Salmonella enterica subsp. salamae]